MVSLSRDDCNAEAEADVEVIVAVVAGNQNVFDDTGFNAMWERLLQGTSEKIVTQKGVICFLIKG